MDTRKIVLGAVLLAVSSVLLFAQGSGGTIPVVLASVAALGMAAGALLVGTSNEGRPV